ncbi:MAG: glycosyltransferase, partial [Ktedonobacteraceae bacterium]
FVVAISHFGRSQLYLQSRYSDWHKISVIRCGLEKEFYEDAPTDVGASSRLICVGRLIEAKGQLLLLRATAALVRKGIDFQLVFAGDGPLRATLEQLIETYRLGTHVRITGWISSRQVRDEILAARALVLPSFAEGLPVAIMEAMSLGRPVLTTYVAGIPELVRNGENGWLVPAGSASHLATAMEDCLSKSTAELYALGQAARTCVIGAHSIDGEVAKLVQCFRGAQDPPSAAEQLDFETEPN